jgi:hypothetical protein
MLQIEIPEVWVTGFYFMGLPNLSETHSKEI